MNVSQANNFKQISVWFLMSMIWVLAGCPSTQGTGPDPETVKQLRKDSPFTRGDETQAAQADTDKAEEKETRYTLTVERMLYPRDNQRVTTALQNLPTLKFDQPGKEHLWSANGLRVSVISPHQLKLFMANLSKPIGNSPTTIPLVDKVSPLTLVSRIKGSLPVRVVEAGDVETIKKLFSGKLQLFVRAEDVPSTEEGEPAHPKLEIIPHHYTPRLTIRLRDNTEKLYDGYTFNDLHLYESFDTSKVWIIWADLPTIIQPNDIRNRPELMKPIKAKPVEPDNSADDDNNADATAKPGEVERNEDQASRDENIEAESPDKSVIPERYRLPGDPMTLGEAMLSGLRKNTPVRVILMLRLYPSK